MPLEKISRDDWILGGVGLLLVILLLFFPWFSISVGPFSATSSGTGAPDGLLGWLAVLATLALIADLGIERMSPATKLPAIAGGRTATRFLLAALAAVFMALKFLFQISHFSDLGYGFWLSVVCVGGLMFLALKANGGSFTMPTSSKGPAV